MYARGGYSCQFVASSQLPNCQFRWRIGTPLSALVHNHRTYENKIKYGLPLSYFPRRWIYANNFNTWHVLTDKRVVTLHFATTIWKFFSKTWSRILIFQENLCSLLHWNFFKNDEKYFLFCIKRSFRSQDI